MNIPVIDGQGGQGFPRTETDRAESFLYEKSCES